MADTSQNLSIVTLLQSTRAPRRLTYSGSLFELAASEYGDALGWSVIAKANGLFDPFLSAPLDLVIPPRPLAFDGGIRRE